MKGCSIVPKDLGMRYLPLKSSRILTLLKYSCYSEIFATYFLSGLNVKLKGCTIILDFDGFSPLKSI